jgi:hypothetical protein
MELDRIRRERETDIAPALKVLVNGDPALKLENKLQSFCLKSLRKDYLMERI